MAIDARIPMSLNTVNPNKGGLAEVGQLIRQRELEDQALQRQQEIDTQQAETRRLQNEGFELQNLDARQQARLKNTTIAAAQLKPILERSIESGDFSPFENAINQRLGQIKQAQNIGADIDANETMDLLDTYKQQGAGEALSLLDDAINVGKQFGFIGGESGSSSEFERILKAASDSGVISPERVKELTQERLSTVARGGVDPTNRLLADIALGRTAQKEKESGTQEAKAEFQPKIAGEVERAKQTAAAEVKKETAFPKAKSAFNESLAKNDRVLSKVDEVLPKIDSLTAGFAGSTLANISGTEARDVQATIDTIKANLGFEELQRMRDNSPTGGALGQVSERELQLLTATVENLEQSQSPRQLKLNLNALKNQLEGSRERIEEAYNRDFGEFEQSSTSEQGGEVILLDENFNVVQ